MFESTKAHFSHLHATVFSIAGYSDVKLAYREKKQISSVGNTTTGSGNEVTRCTVKKISQPFFFRGMHFYFLLVINEKDGKKIF
jgi:hypothetical protein